jgi:hypothetical protein
VRRDRARYATSVSIRLQLGFASAADPVEDTDSKCVLLGSSGVTGSHSSGDRPDRLIMSRLTALPGQAALSNAT